MRLAAKASRLVLLLVAVTAVGPAIGRAIGPVAARAETAPAESTGTIPESATETATAEAAAPPACAADAGALGISRVVEIDTAAGPRFGEQFKDPGFLADHEVVLTFDDGPMRRYTGPILDALDEQCTKATFFSVGRMAISDPAMLRETARRGHTIGFHTWSHQKLTAIGTAAATREIELGLSAVAKVVGKPVAPFFRFPYLGHNAALLAYMERRGIGTFGIDINSRDFRTRNPGAVLRAVLAQLEKKRKGIILFHDIQPSTAGALASLLADLKTAGYKVVHMVPKTPATTLPEYDAIADKSLKAKEMARKANPLSARAVTDPVAGAAADEVDLAQGDAPAGSPAAKPGHNAARKPDWGNLSNDPWQLKAFGSP